MDIDSNIGQHAMGEDGPLEKLGDGKKDNMLSQLVLFLRIMIQDWLIQN